MVSGLFRWVRIKKKIRVDHRADLSSAETMDAEVRRKIKMDNTANLSSRTVVDGVLNKSIKTKIGTDLSVNNASTIQSKPKITTLIKANLVAYLRAPIECAKKVCVTKTSKLSKADGTIIPKSSRKFTIKSSAKINKAYPEYTGVSSMVTTKSSAALGLGSAHEAEMLMMPKVQSYVKLAFWFYPEEGEDGALHIKQVYSANDSSDGLYLEVQ